MKCPKCNYVSHDYLDVCRKCARDLTAFKHEIGLVARQPGTLDLSLVLGGAGTDDLFESVEEEVAMHTGDDDDFDISLDDYAEQPGARRAPARPQRGGRPPEEDGSGMDHLTLELDAANLSAEMAAHLRAAQALPDVAPPLAPAPPPGPGAGTSPGHVTLDIDTNNLSAELPLGALQDLEGLTVPPAPAVPAAPDVPDSLQLDMRSFDLEPTVPLARPEALVNLTEARKAAPEGFEDTAAEDEADPMPAHISGDMVSLQMQDIVLAEALPDMPEALEPPEGPTRPMVVDTARIVAERQDSFDEEADAALRTSLQSFALTADDSLFAGTTDDPSDRDESPEPAPGSVDAPPSEAARGWPTAEGEPERNAAAAASTLRDLPVPALDEPLPLSLDEMPEDTVIPPDMFVLEDPEESTPPEHVTLEMRAADLPDELITSLFEDAAAPARQEDRPAPETPSGAGPEQNFTSSDALALGDLEDITLPGHLTLEFDISELNLDMPSRTMDVRQSTSQPGDAPPPTASAPQHDDEEELLLDLDDITLDDDRPK